MISFQICIFLIVASMVLANEHVFTAKPIQDSTIKNNVINDANLIACNKENCQVIKKYAIADTHSFNCYNKNLAISFEMMHYNKTKIETFGYLLQLNSQSNVISETQNSSSVCQHIKRCLFIICKIL